MMDLVAFMAITVAVVLALVAYSVRHTPEEDDE